MAGAFDGRAAIPDFVFATVVAAQKSSSAGSSSRNLTTQLNMYRLQLFRVTSKSSSAITEKNFYFWIAIRFFYVVVFVFFRFLFVHSKKFKSLIRIATGTEHKLEHGFLINF